jgi:hypothetical protein
LEDEVVVVVKGGGSILVEDRKNADRRRANIDMFIVGRQLLAPPKKIEFILKKNEK